MSWYKKMRFREFLLKEAESEEHKRLKSKLEEWAVSLGYAQEQASFESGVEPDVLRRHNKDPLLFVGDAKCVSTEPASRSATCERLRKYFRDFSGALGSGEIKGGTLAVATNSEAGAKAWIGELNAMAAEYGIVGEDGESSAFKIHTIDPKTFIVHW